MSDNAPRVPELPDVDQERDSTGQGTGIEREVESSLGPILEPFDPEQIDVVTRSMTVDLLLSRIRHDALDLQPDFQRRSGIWTDRRQSRLIESLLLRIPLPTLYAAEDDEENWAVVDGVQRMTAITRFIAPELIGAERLHLHGLEYLGKSYDGSAFDDLPGRWKTRLRETELVVHVIRAGTPEEVKFNIFARINTGGLPLSAQELRHALIPGVARDVLLDLAESSEFQEATSYSIRDERMGDREMALRFVAFRMIDPAVDYTSQDFDEFLRKSMRRINDYSAVELAELKLDWRRSMMAASIIFGPYAFRKRYSLIGERRMPVNKALFDAVAVNLALLSSSELSTLITRADLVNEKFVDLMNASDLERSISQGTGDVAKVRMRFRLIYGLFKEVVHHA